MGAASLTRHSWHQGAPAPSSSPLPQVGPGQRTYMWVDEKGKKSKLSAPQYVDYVMTYVQVSHHSPPPA